MEMVKAEFLWTRVCQLNCNYCGMATGERNSLSFVEWCSGIDNLKQLGCKFIAFYGAEPLADFNNLPEVVGYAEGIGIDTTVITSGVTVGMKGKLKRLYDAGSRSLTMSYDIVPLDDASKTKSRMAMGGLEYFRGLGEVRDLAIVVTLNRLNYQEIVETVKKMSVKGIWTFFDIVHPDRGQEGSKCRGLAKDYLFQSRDLKRLGKVLITLMEMKDEGYLCHASKLFVNKLMANDYDLIKNYNWNCADEDNFPAWVTVDCDGEVYPCDDFQPVTEGVSFPVTRLVKDWDVFKSYYEVVTRMDCSGCCWNTHMDAHFIKSGELDIGEYVHGKI